MSYPEELKIPPELASAMRVCNDCARGLECEKHKFKGFPPLKKEDNDGT